MKVTAAIGGKDEPAGPVIDAPWPVPSEAVFHGPAGAYALDAAPHTEADPIGILAFLLAGAGALIGSGPHTLAGNARHGCAIWPVAAGATSKGGKGTAMAAARAPLVHADPTFFSDTYRSRVFTGFNSGEALVDEIRDPSADDDEDDKKKGDRGATDKRLLVLETEFARFLKAASRDGSVLSMIARQGWDGGRLQVLSRAKKVSASGYHLVVIGHVTVEELRLRMTDTETYGGLANRFLWLCVKRARRLPEGGNVPDDIARHHGIILGKAIAATRSTATIRRTPDAEQRWAEIYDELGDDEPGGLLGAAVARDAAQTLRLSVLYALLDGARLIDVDHIEAAYALWRYCRASAAFIWQDATGNMKTDKLLEALRRAGDNGLDRSQQSALFGRHAKAAEIDAARRHLITAGIAHEEPIDTGGRPRHLLRLTSLLSLTSHSQEEPTP